MVEYITHGRLDSQAIAAAFKLSQTSKTFVELARLIRGESTGNTNTHVQHFVDVYARVANRKPIYKEAITNNMDVPIDITPAPRPVESPDPLDPSVEREFTGTPRPAQNSTGSGGKSNSRAPGTPTHNFRVAQNGST